MFTKSFVARGAVILVLTLDIAVPILEVKDRDQSGSGMENYVFFGLFLIFVLDLDCSQRIIY